MANSTDQRVLISVQRSLIEERRSLRSRATPQLSNCKLKIENC